MERIMELAERNRRMAWRVVRDADIEGIWKSAGAEVRLVGSLRTGLLMKHRDIDFHIYSPTVDLDGSFAAMARLAANPAVGTIECRNLLHTEEACVEWHVRYCDPQGEWWQIDMIHMAEGAPYDGYFERVADRILSVLTPETRRTILRLKYETPEGEKIMGVEYYQAVLRDGVRTYADFEAWRERHPVTGIVEWMP